MKARRFARHLATLAALASGMLASSSDREAAASDRDRRPRNVILMIADGTGYNARLATSMWAGTAGHEFHDEAGWLRLGVSTYALRGSRGLSNPDDDPLEQDPNFVYDSAKAWDATPIAPGPPNPALRFEGYRWHDQTRPDSASTATSISTGKKTFVRGINVDGAGTPIEQTLAELAHRDRKRVGVVTSVLLSGATPATIGGAHHVERKAYCSIALEMFSNPRLDLVAGCGHPDYDNNGDALKDAELGEYRYVGGRAVWNHLQGRVTLAAGDEVCSEYPGEARPITGAEIAELDRWTLVESKKSIRALRKGRTPGRLLIVPRSGERAFWYGNPELPKPDRAGIGATLQAERGSRADLKFTEPYFDPPVATVPTLITMTQVALNAFDDSADGMFLMIEGGAVDWAMHDNSLGRMIEELLEFDRTVAVVIAWIAEHGGWEENLLVVTADHSHLLMGPNARTQAFDPLVSRGVGKLPYYSWLTEEHSNELVPLFVRGLGMDALDEFATRTDPVRGRYLDQTELFKVLKDAIVAPVQATPTEP